MLRVDILHDVGDSLNPAIDRGQIEGGFVQGMGWLTGEELMWDDKGELLTHSPRHLQDPVDRRRAATISTSTLLAGRGAAERHPRQQGRGRAAADAGDLGARGDPRRGGGVPPGGEVALASPATHEAISRATPAR